MSGTNRQKEAQSKGWGARKGFQEEVELDLGLEGRPEN